ncbi:sigma 54-interacting transcriptional regulator [Aquabacterium sp.]|uniref:sigma 54-interacting transcriptional regulator n=1 Tax=Aquabacterium sp. TaxID=1872578 RepID=UPI002B7D0983|nr:sigma 54-interacting transcriptional regulator [Aquabacterium sp.]HSW07276.1 sigma 54-interacting transcriptional regulator [Aquabacterium sp.]
MNSAASILLVDDDPDLLRLMTMRLQAAGHLVQTAVSAEAALAQLAVHLPALVISDVRLPGRDGLQLFDEVRARHPALPFMLLTAHGTIPDAVEATARGALAYLTKPFDGKELLAKIRQALNLHASEAPAARDAGADGPWRRELISRSPRMAELLAEARLVAATDASVLITGDSGTGKELLARAIHRASPRARKPFVAVNCGAIPEALLESELFGHVKGSFTGAQAHRQGLFPAAQGGTVFLDEIGDMPLSLQVKLLRVLQERTVRPVGSNESITINVRVLSATHRNLDQAMAEGLFRADLFYRLNVVKLRLPPLSERREDITLLAQHFLLNLAERYRKTLNGFAPDALEALVSAPWPGNVRQLVNVVEQVCALASSPLIPLTLVQRALETPRAEVLSYADAKHRFERDYLSQLLKLTSGNVADAARLAERNRTEFYRLLQKHGLEAQRFRDEPAVDEAVSGDGDKESPDASST